MCLITDAYTPGCQTDGPSSGRCTELPVKSSTELHAVLTPPRHTQRRQGGAACRRTPASSAATGETVHPDVLEVLFSVEDIQQATFKLGRRLAADYAEKQPLLLGALTGAFTFTADLARCIQPVPQGLAVDFFRASSYGAGTQSDGRVLVNLDCMRTDVAGRHVIVVEDIIDTGATLKAVMRKLRDLGAASVKSAVLLNKEERRNVVIEPDYAALKCPDLFVIGYGLDFNESYRSLPYVGVLKPECYMGA